MDYGIDDLYMIHDRGIHYLLGSLVVMVELYDGIHHFDRVPKVPDTRKSLFALERYPIHYIWLFERMVIIRGMGLHIYFECKLICLGSQDLLGTLVQCHEQCVRNKIMDFRWADHLDSDNWVRDFEQSKLHSERMADCN